MIVVFRELDGDVEVWRAEMAQYLRLVMRDYRSLGLVLCQLCLRRELSPDEEKEYSSPQFTYERFVASHSMVQRVPPPVRQLLRVCFASSPYESPDPDDEDDGRSESSSSLASSTALSLGYQSGGGGAPRSVASELTAEQRFQRDSASLAMQVRRGMSALDRLKAFWESISAATEWGRDIRRAAAGAAAAEALGPAGWTEAMEELRLKQAVERCADEMHEWND